MNWPEWIKLDTVTGEPVRVGTVSLRPQSQALRLQMPWGGYAFNRPVGVLVDDGAHVERVGIIDVTRIAQITLLAWAAIFTLLRWRTQLQSRQNEKENRS